VEAVYVESIFFKTALGMDNYPKPWHLLGWENRGSSMYLREFGYCLGTSSSKYRSFGLHLYLDLGEGKAHIHCSRHWAMSHGLKVPHLLEHSL
jgi:hypothetical protein